MGRLGRQLRIGGVLSGVVLIAGALAVSTPAGASSSSSPKVLLVGTYHGKVGQFTSIQAAVNAAKKGDWILVAPGDYHETDDHATLPKGVKATNTRASEGDMGGVLITTPDIHLRGMNRNSVIVDGDLPGAPTSCDPSPQYQDFGVIGQDGNPVGRDGIVVFKAGNVSIDNLTVCNFLTGTGSSGNEIWWNGGAETGKLGLHGYSGSYLTATSTYYGGEQTAAAYGIFSSNSGGGTWNEMYANNFNDSGYYVGACQQQCSVVIDHVWAENNALGYSGTNSGGSIVIENSTFDNNKDGFDTNSAIAGDPPAPQNGACPGNKISPITHTHSCWVFMHNTVDNNNNANVPQAGSASQGPVGTGMSVSGGRNDTIMDNTFSDNDAWGTIFVPYPDTGTPSLNQVCANKGGKEDGPLGCVFDPEGDALLHNTYSGNGSWKNPSNGDFGEITLFSGEPQNCYVGNTDPDGSSPSTLESTDTKCGVATTSSDDSGPMLDQVLCDTGFGSCPAGASYPQPTQVAMDALPKLPTMPNPCKGVPANAWCPSGSSKR